jgi:hypothetical protein
VQPPVQAATASTLPAGFAQAFEHVGVVFRPIPGHAVANVHNPDRAFAISRQHRAAAVGVAGAAREVAADLVTSTSMRLPAAMG